MCEAESRVGIAAHAKAESVGEREAGSVGKLQMRTANVNSQPAHGRRSSQICFGLPFAYRGRGAHQ